ncbi:transcription factor 7-like [Solea solea]|uniref:transcription factor 7-like n=1 Tax=Solea solea TaxID=90069 RepID=UPI002729D5C7|nr:transcription factor 7-like [Solea solea]
MDVLTELEQLEEAMTQGPDPLQVMMDDLLTETGEPVPVLAVKCESNTPDCNLVNVEELLRETINQLLVNEEGSDPHRRDPLQDIVDELLAEMDEPLPVRVVKCDSSRPDPLLLKMKALVAETVKSPHVSETVDPLPVSEEPKCDPQPLPCPPPTVPALVDLHPCFQNNLVPIGIVNGEVVYALPPEAFTTAFFPAAPPLMTPTSQKNEGQSYIKKPPNAFMLFRHEQRSKVIAELNVRNCAHVNTELGKRWTHLPEQQRLHYFKEADRLQRVHQQLYPKWSTRFNYGKKKRRVMGKCLTPA